jgi:hypothetical protein
VRWNQKAARFFTVHSAALLFGLAALAGFDRAGSGAKETAQKLPVFSCDRAEFPGARPRTSEHSPNNPDHVWFAVPGNRGGGACPAGTYERAIDQLKWLQPEFVLSVGDFLEEYTTGPAKIEIFDITKTAVRTVLHTRELEAMRCTSATYH